MTDPAYRSVETSTAPDDTRALVAETETIRDHGDGTVNRTGVRVERRRTRPIDPIAVAATVILLLAAATAGAWWFLARDETRTVPSVEGLTFDDAAARLEEEGFDPRIERRPSEAPTGTVFEQDPAAGAEADEGAPVRVLVSGGPASVAVPNGVGLSETEARDRMVSAGFEVSSREIFAERPRGTVVSQSPAAGTRTDRGSRVELAVSKGSGLVDVPRVVGLSRGEAEAGLASAGLEVNVVEVPSFEPVGTVVAQNPPGGQLRRGEAVRINVSSGQ